MWDIDVLNLLYKAKKKKINILQIGFMSNTESLWICKNIIEKNNSSKLYIYDFWNQYKEKEDIITLPILQDTFFFNKSKDDFYDGLEKYNKKNIVLFTKNKEQLKKELKKDNLHFDYILINRTYLNNISDYLLLLWSFLKEDGFILINKLGKNEEDLLIIESFIKVYENDIKLKEYSDILIIEKNIEKIKIPKNIQKTLDKYFKLQHFDDVLEIPHYKGKIEWDIQTSDKNLIKSNIVFEKYYDYIFSTVKNEKFTNIIKLDPYRFLFKKKKYLDILKKNITKYSSSKKFSNSNLFFIDNKINIIQNILNDNTDYGIEYIYHHLKDFISKKKNINIFDIHLNKKNNYLYNFFLNKINHKQINKIKFNSIHTRKYNTDYVLDFDLIKKISKKYNKKFDMISLSIVSYLINNSKINLNNNVIEYIYIHLLYLLLSIQKKNGFLLLGILHPNSKIQIQILSILSKFYQKVFIRNIPSYINQYRIVVFAYNFKGINNNILEELNKNYYPIYKLNLEKHILNIWEGNNKYLPKITNIFNCSIKKNIILELNNYNKKYCEFLKEDITIILKLINYLNKLNFSSKIKKYIYNKIIQYQFKNYIKVSKMVYSN